MAEAVLSPLLDAIFENLASSAIEGVCQRWGVEEEVEDLRSTLSAIQAVLEDAEDRQIESKSVKDWLRKLKDVAYDADDVVDEFAVEAQRLELECSVQPSKRRKVMSSIVSLVNSALSSVGWKEEPFQQNIARRMKEIRERLDGIANERHKFHLRARDGDKRVEHRVQRDTSSVVDESIVFGREGDREEIVEAMLSSDCSGKGISVLAIVGMGGLGKTTLAQLVYNDERVKKRFGLCAWVCVSEDFDVKRLTREIIESASKEPCELSSLDPMQRRLQEKLSSKRFLLVLDDVWNENYGYWEQLRVPFVVGAKGSIILVTTRSQTISSIMGATLTHCLKGLSDDGCWSLFTSRAFLDESMASHPNMVAIRQKIMDRCQGLPLAAKTLGGLLSSKKDIIEWESILESEIWNLPGETSDILPVLRLSYHHLPTDLKQCFAFCSIYPKDFGFVKDELVQLWVAEGFIQPKEGKRFEDTGSEHFDDLLLRSFFQHSTSDGHYTMHDLIHDLALSISGTECFTIESGKTHSVLKSTRHSSFSCVSGAEPINFEAFYQSTSLRTFLLINGSRARIEVPRDIFQKLRYMRALDLTGARITELPNSIDSLKHLRYLKLAFTQIKRFPESISSIYTLQTLNLTRCVQLVELPNTLGNLINLRHLYTENCNQLTSMPPGIGRLTSLQTLNEFMTGKERGRGVEELRAMTSLGGRINILNLENVVNSGAAREANLKNKPYLRNLELHWSFNRVHRLQDERVDEEVLEGLQPHPYLKLLSINWYSGTCFPSWMKRDKLLPHLVRLELFNCQRCDLLPPLGKLPSLKSLKIDGMDEVRRIGRELCGVVKAFPMLEELHLKSMRNLEEWCGIEGGDFPRLRKLAVQQCRKLRQLPHLPLPILSHLEINSIEELVSLPQLPSSLHMLVLTLLPNLEEWCGLHEPEFPFLHELLIGSCPKMRKWPSLLPTLMQLQISDCKGFVDLPPSLPCLCKLLVHDCNQRVLSSVPHLASLSSLEIGSFPELKSLPPGFLQPRFESEGLPSTLTSLQVIDCPNLNSLLRGLHLSFIETLKIQNCPQLASLPQEGLPNTLQYLEIQECSMLKERCLKEVGEDWPKISHIPHIVVDRKRISQG